MLCRTEPDAPRHASLSILLLPLDTPGVELRPIRNMAGAEDFNEVFFTDARTPADMIVGERGQGWRIGQATLGHERGVGNLAYLIQFDGEFQSVVELARQRGVLADAVVRRRLADLAIRLRVMHYTNFRNLTELMRAGTPGPQSSLLKLSWPHWHQEMAALAMEIAGPASQIVGEGYELDSASRRPSWSAGRSPSTAAVTRSTSTSWGSGCWDCRANRGPRPAAPDADADPLRRRSSAVGRTVHGGKSVAEQLAHGIARQLGHQAPRHGHLVAGEETTDVAPQLVEIRWCGGVRGHDERTDRLTEPVVRDADDRGIAHPGVADQDPFDLRGVHVLTAADEAVARAADQVEVAVVVQPAQVSAREPAVGAARRTGTGR